MGLRPGADAGDRCVLRGQNVGSSGTMKGSTGNAVAPINGGRLRDWRRCPITILTGRSRIRFGRDTSRSWPCTAKRWAALRIHGSVLSLRSALLLSSNRWQAPRRRIPHQQSAVGRRQRRSDRKGASHAPVHSCADHGRWHRGLGLRLRRWRRRSLRGSRGRNPDTRSHDKRFHRDTYGDEFPQLVLG